VVTLWAIRTPQSILPLIRGELVSLHLQRALRTLLARLATLLIALPTTPRAGTVKLPFPLKLPKMTMKPVTNVISVTRNGTNGNANPHRNLPQTKDRN
jgi:hypothetical protein